MQNDKYNAEHYRDITAHDAVHNVSRNIEKEQNERDAADMHEALHHAKAIMKSFGFEVVGRIVLKNMRTGKVYE